MYGNDFTFIEQKTVIYFVGDWADTEQAWKVVDPPVEFSVKVIFNFTQNLDSKDFYDN